MQEALFPLLQVAHQAGPDARLRLLEDQGIVVRLVGLQAKDLDACSRLFLEEQACLDHPRIVEHHQGIGWQEVGKPFE